MNKDLECWHLELLSALSQESPSLARPPRPEVKLPFKTSPLPRTVFWSPRTCWAGSQHTQEPEPSVGPNTWQSSCPAPSPLDKFCLELTDNFLSGPNNGWPCCGLKVSLTFLLGIWPVPDQDSICGLLEKPGGMSFIFQTVLCCFSLPAGVALVLLPLHAARPHFWWVCCWYTFIVKTSVVLTQELTFVSLSVSSSRMNPLFMTFCLAGKEIWDQVNLLL